MLSNNRPLNAVVLGRVTWPLLHRMSLMYPEKPAENDIKHMGRFLEAFGWLYPCSICATDFRDKMVESKPQLHSRESFATWLCEQHNLVNKKLGKEQFKCSMRRLTFMYSSKS